jgi:hypothetical protein
VSYQVVIQSRSRVLASGSLGEDARLREIEVENPIWRQLLRALVFAFQDDPDLATWVRSNPAGASDIVKPRGPARKTHCIRKHELTIDNVYVRVRKDGVEARTCRQCMLDRARRQHRMRLLRGWHGHCPNCGEIHNPDEVSDACISAIEEVSPARKVA